MVMDRFGYHQVSLKLLYLGNIAHKGDIQHQGNDIIRMYTLSSESIYYIMFILYGVNKNPEVFVVIENAFNT